MSDLNDAVTLAESAVIGWACKAAGMDPDELVDDQDRADLHTLLTAFGKVCQTTKD